MEGNEIIYIDVKVEQRIIELNLHQFFSIKKKGIQNLSLPENNFLILKTFCIINTIVTVVIRSNNIYSINYHWISLKNPF